MYDNTALILSLVYRQSGRVNCITHHEQQFISQQADQPLYSRTLIKHFLPSATATIPALNRDDLEVQCSEFQTGYLPSIEAVLYSNSAINVRLRAKGNVLVKGHGSYYGRLVDLRDLVDSILGAVGDHRALLCTRRGKANTVLHNIVLNQGVRSPTVNRQDSKSRGDNKVSAVRDWSKGIS